METNLPATIDQVLVQLNAILDDALRTGARIGYFGALYERVTTNVRRAIVAADVFEDNTRMEQLDVVFANRFLSAWQQHVANQSPTASWQAAFAVLGDAGPLVVQHRMLGMNAHINLDLGVAAAAIAPTPVALAALKADFYKINDVLARLVIVVEDELGEISPRLHHIEEIAPQLEDRVFDLGMDAAREAAWQLATSLVAAPPDARPGLIAERDRVVADLARAMYPLPGLAGEIQRWIRDRESSDVRYNIQVVAG